MKNTILFITLVTVCIFSCKKPDQIAAPKNEVSKSNVTGEDTKKWKDNEVLVQWIGQRDDQVISMLGASLKRQVLTKAMQHFHMKGFDILNVPDVQAAIQALNNNPKIVPGSVVPNYIVSTQIVYPPLWDSLWNAGKLWDKYDMKVDQVWPTNQGSRSVIINLQDEGTDPYLNHIFTNIDVPHSYDFLHDDSTIFDGPTHGHHATFTAGQIAGRGGLGVIPYGMIVNTKFLEGSGTLTDALEGMDWTVMLKIDSGMNIKISSNSWGYQGDSTVEMYDAIERYRQADILFVAAQGNNNTNTDGSPFYPACSKNANVVGVGAKDVNQNRASFSNYGATTCHLFAPGVSIPCMDFDSYGNETYNYPSGTSMACPEVAGACGLIAAANPTWDYEQIKSFLLNSCVRPMPSVNGLCITNGTLDLTALIGSTAKADTGTAQPLAPLPTFDISPPTPATDVHADAVTDNSVTLAWTNGEDPESGIYFHGILIEWTGTPALQLSTFNNPITITGLPSGTDIKFTVYEINKQGLQSGPSIPAIIHTTGTKDLIPPTTPPNFRILNQTATITTVGWDISTDNVGVYYYEGEGAMEGCAMPFGASTPQFVNPISKVGFISSFTTSVKKINDASCFGVRWRNPTGPREIHYADLPIDTRTTGWWLHLKAVDLSGNSSPYTDTLHVPQYTPTPPPPSPPVINSFAANPSSIDSGQSSILSWNVTGATTLIIDNGIGDVSSLSSIVVSPILTTNYILTAINTGGNVTAQTTITVNAPQPPPPPPTDTTISITATGKAIHITKSPSVGTVEIQRTNRQGGSYSTIAITNEDVFLISMKPRKWYRVKYGTKISNELQL